MKVSPSILACDFTKLKEEIMSVSNADFLHLDVMDGIFVPNITFGPVIVDSINRLTQIQLESHLMIIDAYKYVDAFADAGSDFIVFHVESRSDIIKTIKKIKSRGIKAGLALNPDTPLRSLLPYFESIDLVLVMTVNPGFYGQKFMPQVLPKLEKLKEIKETKKYNFLIEVDGGIDAETAKLVAPYVDIIASGAFIFSSQNRIDRIDYLKKLSSKSII
ncbi:MAG TPA: ribulose-phosphate 3-epimerase [Candidatus Hydrothermia bacterium]|nr:ribulose-phosphate 3-epimerase [Candidatus Hydrothermae bacterium]MDD3648901.1 ribulose-phosphate 3-epimerase [Candidatus Hydrothermia bacterium]MDD5572615.1 ribulose-phosphate 3-epimerase [Candidatus Hydrothermia bacterium]HRD22320.1 ribulose-phosphate 3-epimerase [Candidatus Hydrothermia bacterium]